MPNWCPNSADLQAALFAMREETRSFAIHAFVRELAAIADQFSRGQNAVVQNP